MRGLVRLIGRWYVTGPLLAGLGVLAGLLIFFHVFPGQPKIGIIDIPDTVLNRNTAAFIGEMLDYVDNQGSIKAVVIKMNSPGGGASASEKLFLKTLDLRRRKPVVVVVQDMTASGAYMWSMGANHIYAKPTSLVGSVGVILQLPRVPQPDEDLVFTGPAKLTGAPRRTFTQILELVKESFLEMVITQRGDRLKITRDELSEARLYPGMEAVRLGIVDEIGSDTDAIRKAAGLAGISNYELVDVNAEVLRQLVLEFRRIFAGPQGDSEAEALAYNQRLDAFLPSLDNMHALKEGRLEGMANETGIPQFYHLYLPPSP